MASTSKKSFSTYSDASSVRGKPMRASSQIRTPVKPPANVSKSQKGSDDSDWEIEPLDMMPERMELESVLETFEQKQRR